MPVSITVFTNLFSLKGKHPSENEYVKIFFIWLVLLRRFGNLTADDRVVVAIDTATLDYIKMNHKYSGILSSHVNAVIQYAQPSTMIGGMKMRYATAQHLQHEEPGRMYMYLDVDVIVVNSIRDLFPCEDDNKIFISTEEFLRGLVGDIFHCYYLDDRIQLSEEERARVSQFGGISSGLFAWRFNSILGEFFFQEIRKAIEKDIDSNKEFKHTIDQPYFNEQAIRLFLLNDSILTRFHLEKIGFNCPFGYDRNHVLINYAGNVGDGKFHFEKVEELYDLLNL